MARHRDGVYSFARHVVGNDADAQDLAQETFVRAYIALGRFREGSRFEPWLYTIAANVCRSHLRKARWRFLSLDAAPAETLPVSRLGDPAAAALERDQSRRLHAAIQALPAEQRIIVVLRHLRGHSYQQISEIAGLPVSTVEHRLRAARKVLRGTLDEQPTAGGASR
jgi:RNA polymerase sigma-70 factor (ECF subfamily)